MIRSILLATDGSAPADRAAEFAASLAICHGAKLTVLHVFLSPAVLDEATTLVTGVVNRLLSKGVTDVETQVVEGPPATMITNIAAASKPDLLIMGARGLGTWQGIILGSISMAVTQRVECPVLIVK